jgi:hypothetical protein
MEDDIRNLCQKLIESDQNSEDFRTISFELQTALSKHINQWRENLKPYPLARERWSIKE